MSKGNGNIQKKKELLFVKSLKEFRYKTDLLVDQKEALRHLVKVHHHDYFSEEVRRELNNSKNRGEAAISEGKIVSVFFNSKDVDMML